MIQLQSIQSDELKYFSKLEQASSTYPWSIANLQSSFAVGHTCLAIKNGEALVGSMVVMKISEAAPKEAELLNIVVFKPFQGKGFASMALKKLLITLEKEEFKTLFLEVRESNEVAFKLYRTLGFSQTGERKAYYVTQDSRREAAILMQIDIKKR